MSTFSTDLKIELIGTGEQSGVWGTTTNNNFQNVFEQALVGRVTVPFTDANVTLSATDTVNSQSFRRLYLNCTGANTASRDLIVPTINKTYVVQNNTTGNQNIVIKTSLGTGVTVPNGRTATVYVDGTNVIQAFDYLPVIAVGAGTVSAPSITFTTDSNTGIYSPAADTIAFTEGGTEALRINSSAQIAVNSAGTVSAPVITKADDLNTGIFFPATDAMAFSLGGSEKFRLNGDNATFGLNITTSTLVIKDFSASHQPASQGASIYFGMNDGSFAGMGVIDAASSVPAFNSQYVVFVTHEGGSSNAERMRITSTGNVGIGNTAPDVKLRITGANVASKGQLMLDSTTIAQMSFYNGTTRYGQIYFDVSGTNGGAFIQTATAQPIVLSTNDTERVRITSAGDVGIGTSAPGYFVEAGKSQNLVTSIAVTNINTGTAAQSSIRLNNSTTNFGSFGYTGGSFTTSGVFRQDGGYLYSNGAGGLTLLTGAAQPLYFATDSTERMRIDSSGNVGIGGTNISGYGSGVRLLLQSTSFPELCFADSTTPSGAAAPRIAGGNAELRLSTNNAERMRIDSSGNVLVGSSSQAPVVGLGKYISLYNLSHATISVQAVDGTNDRNATLELLSSGNGGSTSDIVFGDTDTTPVTPSPLRFLGRHSGSTTERMRITSAGNVGIGTTAPGRILSVSTSSDTLVRITGGAANARGVEFYDSSTNGGQIYSVGSDIRFFTVASATSSERMRIDSSGNVQVGTTAAYNSAKLSVNGDLEARGNIKSYYANRTSNLTNGSTLNLMSLAVGSFGAPLCGVLNVQLRDDVGGNLSMSTYLMSAWAGAGANFTAVSTQTYGLGVSFTIAASSVAGGELVITITNTSGRTATSQNFSFLALGSSIPTYAF